MPRSVLFALLVAMSTAVPAAEPAWVRRTATFAPLSFELPEGLLVHRGATREAGRIDWASPDGAARLVVAAVRTQPGERHDGGDTHRLEDAGQVRLSRRLVSPTWVTAVMFAYPAAEEATWRPVGERILASMRLDGR